jgi:hypothetical protein
MFDLAANAATLAQNTPWPPAGAEPCVTPTPTRCRISPRRCWRRCRRGDRMKRHRSNPLVPFVLVSLCGCAVAQPASTPAPSSAPGTLVNTVVSGERQRIDFISVLNPDCTTAGYVTVRIITPPSHGELTTERGVDYPVYPKDNQRYQCNLKKVPLTNVYYKSNPGYVGTDTATIEMESPIIAIARTRTFMITVK